MILKTCGELRNLSRNNKNNNNNKHDENNTSPAEAGLVIIERHERNRQMTFLIEIGQQEAPFQSV